MGPEKRWAAVSFIGGLAMNGTLWLTERGVWHVPPWSLPWIARCVITAYIITAILVGHLAWRWACTRGWGRAVGISLMVVGVALFSLGAVTLYLEGELSPITLPPAEPQNPKEKSATAAPPSPTARPDPSQHSPAHALEKNIAAASSIAHPDDLAVALGKYPPPGIVNKNTVFSGMETKPLQIRVQQVCTELEALEKAYQTQLTDIAEGRGISNYAVWQQVDSAQAKFSYDFQKTYWREVGDLHDEMLTRLKSPYPTSSASGLNVDGYRGFLTGVLFGKAPLGNLSHYLRQLADRL